MIEIVIRKDLTNEMKKITFVSIRRLVETLHPKTPQTATNGY